MSFATAINCLDGRVQEPVAKFLKKKFGASYVDAITAPGPVKVITNKSGSEFNHIEKGVGISINKHDSKGVAVVAHYDCAGFPAERREQIEELKKAVLIVKDWVKVPVVGLWVGANWEAEEIEIEEKGEDK